MLNYLDPEFLITTFGLLGIFFIIFAESGLFFGFFFPGDSLLLTAGLFASRGDLNLLLLILLSGTAAIAGDSTGYWVGRKMGEKLFAKEESRFFKKSHLLKAQDFYNKHGGKTIILARFMPFVRTFAPMVAGAAKMKYSVFLVYNVLGGLLWGVGLPLAGFYLGSLVDDKYFLLIVFAVIFLSVAPTGFHVIKEYVIPRFHSHRKS